MPNLPLTIDAFREVASRYATGIVVVTTIADGFDHAMTATSFTTVSLDPMLVLVCVEADTRFRDALVVGDDGEPLAPGAGREWAISVLPMSAASTASWFATKGRPLHGQFDNIAHHRGGETGAVIIDGALAAMEVRTTVEYPAGDHTIVLAEVLSLACDEPDTAVDEAHPSQLPLLYWARRYRSLS